MLQLKSQSIEMKEKSCIGLIQENLIEFLLQTSLSYILQAVVYVNTTTNLP